MSDTAFSLGTFSAAGSRPFAGLIIADRVLPLRALHAECASRGFHFAQDTSLLDLLGDWDRAFDVLRQIATGMPSSLTQQFGPVSELHVHAPIEKPGTIYCSGADYRKHVVDLIVAHSEQSATQGMTPEQKHAWGMKLMDERAASGTPFIFIKPQSTVTGPFDPIIVPPESKKPDWELELGVVIGRRARRVTRERALEHVAGYVVVNDITLRDKVFRRKSDSPELGMDFAMSKGAPSFLPMGPYLAPAGFVGDPQQLRITLRLNGKTMQDEATSDMIFTVARLIEYISAGAELQPGDLICTGSPAGNGMASNRFIQEGDVLEGSITGAQLGLGTQRNPCVLERYS